jgi:hypothetical protein
VWKLYYWTAFTLCWFILPFLSEYVRNGEFTFRARVNSTITRNVRYYTMICAVFGILLVYLWVKDAFSQ